MSRVRLLAASIAVVFGLFFSTVSVSSTERLEKTATLEEFLVDAILQLYSADVTGDAVDELLLVGRNYEKREVFVYVLGRDAEGFSPLWRSENLNAEAGHIAIAAGRFTSKSRQLAIVSDKRLLVYEWVRGTMKTVFEQAKEPGVQEASAVLLPGDEFDSLLLTEVSRISTTGFVESVAAWRFTGREFERQTVLAPIGNVRSLSAAASSSGPFLVLDVGVGSDGGDIVVARWDNQAFVVKSRNPLRPAPVFALSSYAIGGRDMVIIAGDRGKVFLYEISALGALTPVTGPVSLGWGLVSSSVGEFLPNKPEVVIVEYPNTVHILRL